MLWFPANKQVDSGSSGSQRVLGSAETGIPMDAVRRALSCPE